MDVCKCIVPLRQAGTLNSCRNSNPLVWLVEGEEWWEVAGCLQGFLPLNWGGTEQNSTVTCMVLRLTTGVKIQALSHDEFRGPRCDFVWQVALVTTNNTIVVLGKC
ncbi:uncharacterized protein TNCV_3889741 [Trichonephila clavipes]|nr:uncharacterized protein TNCV_3889741 [Trichonephila clavipes]